VRLTPEEAWLYRHNGFIVGPERLSDELVGELNAEVDRQIADEVDPLVWKAHPADADHLFVNRVSDLLQRSPVFLEAAAHPAVLEPLESILGHNFDLLTNWHNHVMVRPGGSPRIKWHRGASLHSPMLVTVLIYLTESTVENGCVRMVPGSHVTPFGAATHLVDEPSREEAKKVPFHEHRLYRLSLPVPMPAGGILIFNDALFHGADVNRTGGDRRSMTLGYMAHDDHATSRPGPERLSVSGTHVYRGLSETQEEDLAKALPHYATGTAAREA
jgi:phytanoyl-CoA hydroxylase